MSRAFKIGRCPYDRGHQLYKKGTFEFDPGVTMLVGCNGCGKSTLIRKLQEKLSKEGIQYIVTNQVTEDRHVVLDKAIMTGNTSIAATLFTSSEGESSMVSLGVSASKIGSFVKEQAKRGERELWFFFDGVDSGLDISAMSDVEEYLLKTILQHCKELGIVAYVICATNAYEMTKNSKCLDVVKGEYVTFESYESYAKFVSNSAKLKNKRDKSL